MERIEILRKIFDSKIIAVLNLFLENPEKQFSLTQIATLSKVNITTALRILKKLTKQNIVELIPIGKSKAYKLIRDERTLFLNKIIKSEGPLLNFIERIKNCPELKKIVLEKQIKNKANLLIVGNFLTTEKISNIAKEIKNKYNFEIQFVELNEKQFNKMRELGMYELNNKIIWESEKEDYR